MALVIRDFDTMVNATLDRIVDANIGFTAKIKDKGSVTRTIIESVIAEIDIQYYGMLMIYGALSPDDASGEDLDKLLTILDVHRNMGTYSSGIVRFSRSTPATSRILIESNYEVETPSTIDSPVSVITTESKYMEIGQTYVDVAVKTLNVGYVFIPSGMLTVMPNPIIGIESVTNQASIQGGTDIETDESLRERGKTALSAMGKGTDSALESALKAIAGVIDAVVTDQARGAGTSDITIICDQIPPSQATTDAIDAAIKATKASGVNILKIYPTVVSVNITATTTGDDDIAGNAIKAYTASLGAGDTLILSQLQFAVLKAYNDPSIDFVITTPSTNQIPTASQVLRAGTITINGVVWNG